MNKMTSQRKILKWLPFKTVSQNYKIFDIHMPGCERHDVHVTKYEVSTSNPGLYTCDANNNDNDT